MLEKVKSYVEKWQMLTSEDRVIVGVSGGADSICLVLVLLELKKTIGFEMLAVHVNHGIRGREADADEAYVKAFCAEHDVLCESYFADVELIAKKRKQSTEEAGREVRREFFAKTMQRHNGTKIALAHHQNDSAETFLMNLARGTGLKGLGGIAPVKGQFIRPLLCLERNEIEQYLDKQGISYCVDKTNESDDYTRNRIRNHVIPYIKEEINSKFVEHMSETMEQIRVVQEFLEEQTRTFYEAIVVKTDEGLVLLEEPYRNIPKAIKPLLLKQVLTEVSGREKDLEAVHIKQLQELFDKQTGRKVDLPYQMEARRIYEGIWVGLKEEQVPISEEVTFDLTQAEMDLKWRDVQIQCKLADNRQISDKALEKSDTSWFDCDIIKNSICFRTRRQGDYITIHSDGKTQKLKSYFINEKIPQEERDKILLVADGSEIVWIVGYRRNCRYQVGASTKRVLEIRIDEGENNGREN